MPTPTRILRTLAEELDPSIRDRTPREDRQFERIMKCAPKLLTFWNTDRISFTALAIAMKMAPATLRRHFVDLPALLGYLIHEHLRDIAAAIAGIPFDAPDHYQRRRAAYLRATHTGLGGHSEKHLLMLNNLANLPDDVRLPLLEYQTHMASCLAPRDELPFLLSVIDNPFITPRRLEAILATPEYAWHAANDAIATPPEPPSLIEPPEPAAIPAETGDHAKIRGAKIPGPGIWMKNDHVSLDHLNWDDLQPRNAGLPAPPVPIPQQRGIPAAVPSG